MVGALPEGAFDAVVTGDEVAHGKPHPEPYLAAARLLGVDVGGLRRHRGLADRGALGRGGGRADRRRAARRAGARGPAGAVHVDGPGRDDLGRRSPSWPASASVVGGDGRA